MLIYDLRLGRLEIALERFSQPATPSLKREGRGDYVVDCGKFRLMVAWLQTPKAHPANVPVPE